MTTLFATWESFEDALGSDHIPSIIRINLSVKKVSTYFHKLSLSGLDWKTYQSTLISLAPDLLPQLQDPNISHLDKYETLINSFKNTVLSLIPPKQLNQTQKKKISTRNKASLHRNVRPLLLPGGTTLAQRQFFLGNKLFVFLKSFLPKIITLILRGRKPLLEKFYVQKNVRVGDPFAKIFPLLPT